ncbi:MAG: AbrB/MazE/SpoVT family DNA-binding domain-containing protein [Thermomonas sp.]|uniref:AbrB/MazE/SpoVT family DNA-binding domain-containing protein n=1 Tax=Thermomonas sp. TaxID=1971895 RepID=UPI0039E444E7
METTKLSTKGQVVLPKAMRDAMHWEPGQELQVLNAGGYLIVKKVQATKQADWSDIVGSLSRYRKGKPMTDEEMHEVVRKCAVERYERSLKK